jgi:hypothetical protein
LTATVGGSPTYGASGPIFGKNAIGFSASTQYFTVDDHENLDLGNGPFTLEYWVARDTDTNVWQIILNKGTNGYSTGIGSASDSLYSDRYTIGKTGIAVIGYNGSETVTANSKFNHVVITRSGTGGADTHKIYVNGVERTFTAYGIGATTAIENTTAALEIGREGAGSTLSGKLAYLALYKTVLSSTRVTAHYEAGKLRWGYAQAQTYISTAVTTYRNSGQAKAHLKTINFVYGQSSSQIKNTYKLRSSQR